MVRLLFGSKVLRLLTFFLVVADILLVHGPAQAAAAGTHDPCSFLTVAEVEAVMGTLAGPPFRAGEGGTPRPNGAFCRYESADRRAIAVSVTWDGGKQLLDMMGAVQAGLDSAGLNQLKLLDGTAIAGHWEQAALNGCCEFNALHGDQVVTVDVSGSRATIAQAAALADAALRRLDQPLAVSGAAGLQSAQDRAARRPKPRNVCDLVTAADAEAIAGVSLSQPPTGSNSKCRYAWPMAGIGIYELELTVMWQGGFSEMRTTSAAIGNASSMLGMNTPHPGDAGENGPWDEVSTSIIGVSAVKGDVRVSVEGGPIQQKIQRAFVEKALTNVSKQ